MQIPCIHAKCGAEAQRIVRSSTNPGVLFATCDQHVDEVHEFVDERFRGRIFVSVFSRLPRVNGWAQKQTA
jgi:hypothetical protein